MENCYFVYLGVWLSGSFWYTEGLGGMIPVSKLACS